MLISLAILSFILAITIFSKPILETENKFVDQQQGYIEDNRPKLEIANEKFEAKISILEEVSNQENSDEFSNVIKYMSKEKIDNLNNNQYEENIMYCFDTTLMNTRFLCLLEIRNDTLFQKYNSEPLADSYELRDGYITEVYVRLK